MAIKIVTLTGPSGSGKTTLLHHLLSVEHPRFMPIISTTTRKPRPTDLEYEYVSEMEFKELRRSGAFAWTTEMPGENPDELFFYGTKSFYIDRAMAEDFVSVMILVPGTVQILHNYIRWNYDVKGLESVHSVYIDGLSEEVLARRMMVRGDSLVKIAANLDACRLWRKEVERLGCFDEYLFNWYEEVAGLTAASHIIRKVLQSCNLQKV